MLPLLMVLAAAIVPPNCNSIMPNDSKLIGEIETFLSIKFQTNPSCKDLLQAIPFLCNEPKFQNACCGNCLSGNPDRKMIRISGPDHSVPPFWEYDKNKIGNDRFSGFFLGYLEELMTQVGVDFEIIPTSFEMFLTGAVLTNGIADCIPSWLSEHHYSAVTQGVVSLSLPLIELDHEILIRKYESSGSMWGIFDPYTTELWLLICGGILASAFVFWLVESRYASKMTRTPSGGFGALYFALTTLMIGGEGYEVVTWLGRVLRIGTLFYVLIIQSTYTANLASILTAKTIKADGPGTFAEAQNTLICCPFGKVEAACQHEKWIQPPTEFIGNQRGIEWCTNELLSNGVNGIMADSLTLTALLANNCGKVKLSGISFNPTMISLAAVSSESDFIRRTNAAVVKTKFSGRYSELFTQFHPPECPEFVDEGEEAVVGIRHMSGLFIIFACVCALVVSLWIGRTVLEKLGVMDIRKSNETIALPDQMILEAAVETKAAVDDLAYRQAVFERQVKRHLNIEYDENYSEKGAPDSDSGSV